MRRNGKVLLDCLRKNRMAIVLFVCTQIIETVVFLLYDIMAEPLVYASVIVTVLFLTYLIIDYLFEVHRARTREQAIRNILITSLEGVESNTLRDEDYAEMIETLHQEIDRLRVAYSEKTLADGEYYAAWVHQIKTPIAVMKLQLTEDTPQNRALSAELFRIEQYVEMVLDYMRLDSSSNDLVIREYALDELIREVLRKYASQFVLRKLRLSYEGTDVRVVTDKKWLCFMLEQLIANAIKYTPEGGISIEVEGNCIRICDTGIGIAPEDIPRIFEKGFTGNNGRLGEKSSGLGLFLTQKAANLLAATLQCQSEVGQGTTFSIELPKREM